MKVVEFPRTKVHLSVPLIWNVRDRHGTLLLAKGLVIRSERQLEELLERGAFVDVEEVAATQREEDAAATPALVFPPSVIELWTRTTAGLRSLLSRPAEKPAFAADINTFALHILQLLDRNVDIGIYKAFRQESQELSDYGFTHSIHTAVLCILLSRRLGWPEERRMSLLKAALTMNLTILELQGRMAAQDGPMRDPQRAAIAAHPQATVELLKTRGVDDNDWLSAIAQHHEDLDGTGYPIGCTDMGEMAVALRVCDVFMAKISPRALREAISPQDAIRQLYREDKGGLISTGVIKEIGIYPPGDFVKLASGELAVVVQRTANAKAPIVAAITDSTGRPINKTFRHDTGKAEFAIVGTVSDKSMLKRLPPERLYGFSMSPLVP